MPGTPLIDTHIWVWWMLGDDRLSPEEVRFLDELPPEARPRLSAISLWEMAMLVDLRRLDLKVSLDSFLQMATSKEIVVLALLNWTK